MTLPPGGAMDVLFSFDTTGSMSSILEEVQGRLQEMIQRLQADIPGIRIGVIAHGDYCDEEVFYLEKHIDFSQNVADLCTFVGGVEGTGGGDQDECYELILRKVRKDFSWAPVSNKVLVLIGDANPHEPDYDMNVDNIDWREEVKLLAEQNVKIYAVQAFDNEGVDEFYKTMAEHTMGHYLKLDNFSNICDFIMAICYRERGDDFFTEYETEVRARYAKSGLQKDLEGMFGTLRRNDSTASSIGSTLALRRIESTGSSSGSTLALRRIDSTASSSGSTLALRRNDSTASTSGSTLALRRNDSTASTSGSTLALRLNDSTASSNTLAIPAALTPISSFVGLPQNAQLPLTKSNTSSESSINISFRIIRPKATTKTKNRKQRKPHVFNGKEREKVPERKFALRGLKWSSWRLVYTPQKPSCVKSWRKINRGGNCWRKKEFFSQLRKFGQNDMVVYEISVQTKPKCKKHVVFCNYTHTAFDHGYNWERNVLGWTQSRSRVHRKQINRVLKNGCNVFIRRAHVKKRQTKLIHNIHQYHYAWDRSISGITRPERTVIKNKILISGMEY